MAEGNSTAEIERPVTNESFRKSMAVDLKGIEESVDRACEVIDSLREDREELLVALRKLANEASGFWALADTDTHGHTNMSVLRMRIDEAFAAIRRTEGGA